MVRDLGGKIAAQSFDFDKEDSISFGCSDSDDGDAEESPKKESKPSQDECFNKLLSQHLSPSFRTLTSGPDDGQKFSSPDSRKSTPFHDSFKMNEEERWSAATSGRLSDHDNSKVPSSTPSSEKRPIFGQTVPSYSSPIVDSHSKSVFPGEIVPKSFEMPSVFEQQLEPVITSPKFVEVGSLSASGGLDQAEPEPENSPAGTFEESQQDEDGFEDEEELDLQLYLSDNSDDGDAAEKVESSAVGNFIEKLVEAKDAAAASVVTQSQGSHQSPIKHPHPSDDLQPKPVEAVKGSEVDHPFTRFSPGLSESSENEADEPISVPVVFNNSFDSLSPVRKTSTEKFSPVRSGLVTANVVHDEPDDDGSDSSEVEIHRCQSCGTEFRTVFTLKIHRTHCCKNAPAKKVFEIPAKTLVEPPPKVAEKKFSPPKATRLSSSSCSSSSDESEQVLHFHGSFLLH